MRLVKAEIFGFGKWQHQTISFEEEGLTVLYGENEAGKSTLHAFILYILFDLPPRKWKAYEPKTGGSVGGRLHLSHQEEGQIIVERVATKHNGEARCLFENGEEEGEPYLKRLLNGIDRSTFESIFSFGLKSLQDIQALQEDDIGNVLFGIGMTGSKQIYETEKRLEKQLEQRYKKRGKNPEMNQQLQKVKELEKQYKKLKDEEASYQSYKDQEQRLESEVEELRNERSEMKSKLSHKEKLLQATQPVHRYQEAKARLQQYDRPLAFPEDGLERYYHVKDQLLPYQSELNVLENTRKQDEQKLEQLPNFYSEKINLAKTVTNKAEWYEIQKDVYHQNKTQVEHEKQRIQQAIADLGIGLNFEDLEELDLPFYTQELWENLVEERKQLHNDEENHQDHVNALNEQKQQTDEKINELSQQILSDDLYQQYKEIVEENKEEKIKRKLSEQKKEEREKQAARIKKQQEKRKKASKQFLMAGSFLFLLGIVLSFILDNYWFAAIAALFMGTIGVGARMMMSSVSEQTREEPFSEPTPQYREEEIQQFQEEIHAHEQAKSEIDRLKQLSQQLHRDEIQHEEWMRTLQQRKNRLYERIEEQQTQFDFLGNIALAYWPKTFQRLYQLQQDIKDWRRKEEAFLQKQEQIQSFVKDVLFAADRLEMNHNREVESVITYLHDYVKQNEKAEEHREGLIEKINETKEQEEAIRQKMQPLQQEIQHLFTTAQVEDEEAYIRTGKRFEQVLELEEQQEESKHQVATLFAEEDNLNDVLHQPLDKSQLTEERDQLYSQIESLDQKLEVNRQEWADVKSILKRLEENESFSTIRHQFMLEKNRLREQAKEWAVYQVAYSTLQKTKAIFQKERMPLVIEYCHHFFNILTKGAYIRVFPPKQDQSFVVESKDGYQYDANDLSQGTKEQLYVSLRLALSRVISEDHPLPFIIDDAFVNFDPTRKHEMMQLLGECSTSQQVLYLTCPPDSSSSNEDSIKNLYKKYSFYLP